MSNREPGPWLKYTPEVRGPSGRYGAIQGCYWGYTRVRTHVGVRPLDPIRILGSWVVWSNDGLGTVGHGLSTWYEPGGMNHGPWALLWNKFLAVGSYMVCRCYVWWWRCFGEPRQIEDCATAGKLLPLGEIHALDCKLLFGGSSIPSTGIPISEGPGAPLCSSC